MTRLWLFLLKLVLIVITALWVIHHSGRAHMEWHGYAIETSSAFVIFCIGVMAYGLFILHKAWRGFRHGPETFRLRRKIGKLHEGHAHLAHGLTAVAAGHAAEAGRRALGARKLLGVTTATQLLQAQAAQLAGDHQAARALFLSLAAHKDSAVLGYRGLIMEAFRAKDWKEAELLTEKLSSIRPDTPWLNLIRFELASQRHHWGQAYEALKGVKAAGLMEPTRALRHQAATLLATSDDEAAAGRVHEALQEAERARQAAPLWLPAVITLARRQMDAGHARAARRTIARAWPTMPHPELAALYSAHGEPDRLKSYKRISGLCRPDDERIESRLALAEAALAADIWGEARRLLLALIAKGAAPQTVFRLLAKCERGEKHDETAAMRWLSKALDAPCDKIWLCESCGGVQEKWLAICRHCGGFDTLEWARPGESRKTVDAQPLLASWRA